MKIIKYKKLRNGKYLVELDCEKMELYEEVILKNGLLLKKEISLLEFDNVKQENNFYNCYYIALRYIKVRSRSIYEVRKKLLKDGFSCEYIDKCIQMLLKQGYLNDSVYAKSFLQEQLITTARGPKRICEELKKKGVSDFDITEVMSLYTLDIQKEKLKKIITKMIRSNKNKSNLFLRKKIYSDLIRDGFSSEIINEIINQETFNSDDVIKEREYEKIYRRLSKKYEGLELELKVREQMIRKGFYE